MRIIFADGPVECSDEFSRRDFTTDRFVDIPDGADVYASCFSCEVPDTQMFRADMRGVTFRNCNLMNVHIPAGNTVIDCQTESYRVQNDLNDWLLDGEGNPVKPVDHLTFTKRGLPMPSPDDIPARRAEKRVNLLEGL